MKLDEYLTFTNFQARQFAETLGRSEAYISKLRRFKFTPSLIEGLILCHLTEWQVMPTELVDPERLAQELQIRGIDPEEMPRLMAVG